MILSAASIAFSDPMPASSLTTIPTTPARLDPTRHNGRSSELPAYFQGHQVGYNRCCLELQHVPLWTSLVDLRVCQVQTEDMQNMHGEGVGRLNPPYKTEYLLILCSGR